MSRSSLRMKQYRPVSADFSKVGNGLSSVFGLHQESNDGKTSNGSNGVLLINCKYYIYLFSENPVFMMPYLCRMVEIEFACTIT